MMVWKCGKDLPTLASLVPGPGVEAAWGPEVSLLPRSSMMGRSRERKYWNVCRERGEAPE